MLPRVWQTDAPNPNKQKKRTVNFGFTVRFRLLDVLLGNCKKFGITGEDDQQNGEMLDFLLQKRVGTPEGYFHNLIHHLTAGKIDSCQSGPNAALVMAGE